MRYSSRMPGSVMPGAGAYPQMPQAQTAVSNSQILGYLGRALSLEFSAGQHYLAQASLAKFRHEISYAEGFVTLANEEFQHANLITDRMVAQGALPAGSVLRPAGPANNIAEALRSCEEREIALIQLYSEASQYCANFGAQEDYALFNRLLEEEQTQLVRVQSWLDDYFQTLRQTYQPNRSFV
ncbi:ferritin-like domain-containing protein [Thiomicrorhabdus sp. ZW0627]|uniref:ferritin-like domain-containing protein n=1 Tax=Thiomicrorhabdus sp. ZW0627 TaxID=3039774 RepID=UPI0024364F07|nr:ferritin-like domain-containing protein [Thiomicrorhabdus sp. ZW0627]MDG6773482.1 ferritin-like domain-containing protein [Thiomicrorhabdus sp. ZW0627]